MLSLADVQATRTWIVFLFAMAPACASPSRAEKPSPPGPAAPADAEHAVAAARDKLALAKMQMEIAHKKADDARAHKERELELAKAELAQFEEVDAPNRAAKAHLDLARRQDALFEQQEELVQLEMMYEKEDLADKTREIVLQRGKRRVDRAKDELAIVERETQALEARTLPRERSKLALEAEAKARELEEMVHEAEATMLEKRIAVGTAEIELQTAEAKGGSKP
jgi:hypothetical protein